MQGKFQDSALVHKKRIPSLFSGTFFNRHKLQFESGGLQTTYSNVYYFVPSTTDRSEEVNRYLGSVNLSPIDMTKSAFETENNVSFDPSKLDIYSLEKEVKSKAVVKMLKKITENADDLLSEKSVDFEVDWIGTSIQRLPQNKYKMSY